MIVTTLPVVLPLVTAGRVRQGLVRRVPRHRRRTCPDHAAGRLQSFRHPGRDRRRHRVHHQGDPAVRRHHACVHRLVGDLPRNRLVATDRPVRLTARKRRKACLNCGVAARVARIKPSPSTAAADRARELREAGRDIVNLTVGEPDFDTPDFIKKAACDAIMRGETKYTAVPGTVALREAIRARLLRRSGVDYPISSITVSNGGKQVIFNALLATVGQGDEVVIPAPLLGFLSGHGPRLRWQAGDRPLVARRAASSLQGRTLRRRSRPRPNG